MLSRGLLIVFEGIDGTGKDTQLKIISRYFKNKKIKLWLTGEPTKKSKEGSKIIQLLSGEIEKTNKDFLLSLFLSDRKQHTIDLVQHLSNNELVLSSRYDLSSYAYQLSESNTLEHIYRQHCYLNIDDLGKHPNGLDQVSLIPDLTFYFDLSPRRALKRIEHRILKEGYEKENLLKQARHNYQQAIDFLVLKDGRNIIQLDGGASIKQITQQLIEVIEKAVETREGHEAQN